MKDHWVALDVCYPAADWPTPQTSRRAEHDILFLLPVLKINNYTKRARIKALLSLRRGEPWVCCNNLHTSPFLATALFPGRGITAPLANLSRPPPHPMTLSCVLSLHARVTPSIVALPGTCTLPISVFARHPPAATAQTRTRTVAAASHDHRPFVHFLLYLSPLPTRGRRAARKVPYRHGASALLQPCQRRAVAAQGHLRPRPPPPLHRRFLRQRHPPLCRRARPSLHAGLLLHTPGVRSAEVAGLAGRHHAPTLVWHCHRRQRRAIIFPRHCRGVVTRGAGDGAR